MRNDQSTFTAEYGYLIDEFDELQDLRWSDLQYLDEYRELKLKKNDGLPIDQNRLDELESIFKNKIITAARWNKFQNALVGMQTFIKDEVEGFILDKQQEITDYTNSKKQEIDTVVTDAQNTVNATKDAALISIENKKDNVIEYLDGTTAGALRNDIGDMSQSIIEGRSLIDKTNALKIQVDSNTEEVNKIGDLTQLETEEKNTIVGAINEHSAQMAELAPKNTVVAKSGDTMTGQLYMATGFAGNISDTITHDKVPIKFYRNSDTNWGGIGFYTSGDPFIAGLNGLLYTVKTSTGQKFAVFHEGTVGTLASSLKAYGNPIYTLVQEFILSSPSQEFSITGLSSYDEIVLEIVKFGYTVATGSGRGALIYFNDDNTVNNYATVYNRTRINDYKIITYGSPNLGFIFNLGEFLSAPEGTSATPTLFTLPLIRFYIFNNTSERHNTTFYSFRLPDFYSKIEGVSAWKNTTDRISKITFKMNATDANMNTGCKIKVYGR